MKTFLPISEIKKVKEKASKDVMDKFIDIFNKSIKKNDMVINTGLDKCPTLNDTEFEKVRKQALKQGYVLTRFDDNYSTTSYQVEIEIKKCEHKWYYDGNRKGNVCSKCGADD